jgi:hypothetical protein
VDEERLPPNQILLQRFLPPPALSVPQKEECKKHVTYFGDNKEFKLDMEKTSQGEKATGCSVSGELEVRMITSFSLRFFYPGLLTLFNITCAR